MRSSLKDNAVNVILIIAGVLFFSFNARASNDYYPPLPEDVVENVVGAYVNDNGKLKYDITINIPESINGLKPTLVASYRQGSGRGNLGGGFSLSVGSSISRCSKRMISHGVSGSGISGPGYTYCLDGIPLNHKSNTLVLAPYSSENQKVTYSGSFSNPDSWKVEDGVGYQYEYRVIDHSVSDSNKNWLLVRKKDVWGNAIDYEYYSDGRIKEISYPGFSIDVSYQALSNYYHGYSNGAKRLYGYLVDAVTLNRNNNALFKYEFRYERFSGYMGAPSDRLAGVRKCYVFGDERCTRELVLSYSDVQGESPGYESRAYPADKTVLISKEVIARHWDLDDMDGIPPYIKANVDNSGLEDVCLYSSNDTLVCALGGNDGEYVVDESMSDAFELEGADVLDYYSGLNFVDLNNDGYVDLCIADEVGIKCAGGNGRDSTTGKYFINPEYVSENLDFETGYQFIDVNSDGLLDLCGSVDDDSFSCYENVNDYEFSGSEIIHVSGDFSKKESAYDIPESHSLYAIIGYYENLKYTKPVPTVVDVNGDQTPDLCSTEDGELTCRLGDFDSEGLLHFSGNGERNTSVFYQAYSPTQNFNMEDLTNTAEKVNNTISLSFRWVDINSDGLVDICYVRNNVFLCRENTENSWANERVLLDLMNVDEEYQEYSYDTLNQIYSSIEYFDVNTDGYLDVCYMWMSVQRCAYQTRDEFSTVRDRLRITEDEVLFEKRGHYFSNYLRKIHSAETDYIIYKSTAVYGPIFYMDDVNGDRVTDVCMRTWSGVECHSNKQQSYYALLTEAKDSFGNAVRFNHESLASGLNYQGANKTSSWVEKVPLGLMLDSIDIDTGVNEPGSDFESIAYEYAGYRVDPDTGEASFETIAQYSSLSGKRQVTEFYQNNNLGGKVKFVHEYQHDHLLSKTQNIYTADTSSGGFVRTILNDVYSWKYDPESQILIRTDQQEYQDFDSYGFPGLVKSTENAHLVSGLETHTTTTINTYKHDAENWILGKPDLQVVTHDLTGEDTQTRTVDYEYYSTTNALKTEIIEPDSAQKKTITYQYEANGLVNNVIVKGLVNDDLEQSRTTFYTYDDIGRKLSVTNALGQAVRTEYHPYCLGVESEYDANNRLVLTHSYSNSCARIGSEFLTGVTQSFEITWLSGSGLKPNGALFTNNYILKSTESSNTGSYSEIYSDRAGRAVKEVATISQSDTATQQSVVYSYYDNHGMNTAKTRPLMSVNGNEELPQWQTSEYDDYFRPSISTITAPNGQVVEKIYNYDGLSTTTYFDGVNSTQTVGVFGKVIYSEEFEKSISYSYSSIGELRKTEQEGSDNATVLIEYDEFGFKESQTEPDTGFWQYRYNAFGELYWQKDPAGNVIYTQFDQLGRMISSDIEEGHREWKYYESGHGIGQLQYEISPDGIKRQYEYNAIGLLVDNYLYDESVEINRTHYLYDNYGRLVTTENNKNSQDIDMITSISLSRDEAGRVQSVSVPADNIKGYDFESIETSYQSAVEQVIEIRKRITRIENRLAYHAGKISYYESKVGYFRRASNGLEYDTSVIDEQIQQHQSDYDIMMDVYSDLLEKAAYYDSMGVSNQYTYKGYDSETGHHGFGYERCDKTITRFFMTRCSRWEKGFIGLSPDDFQKLFPDTSDLKHCHIEEAASKYAGRDRSHPSRRGKYIGSRFVKRIYRGVKSVNVYAYRFEICNDRKFSPAVFERKMANIYRDRAKEEEEAIAQLQNDISQGQNEDVIANKEIVAYRDSWAPVSINSVVFVPVKVPYDALEEVILNRQVAIEYYHERQNHYQSQLDAHKLEKSTVEDEYATVAMEAAALEQAKHVLENNISQYLSLQVLEEASQLQQDLEGQNVVVWAALSYDASGGLKDELFGNGVMTRRVINPETGMTDEIITKKAGGDELSHLNYTYTTQGNLAHRNDTVRGITETFEYADNQLDYWSMDSASGISYVRDYEYDDLGNVTSRKGSDEAYEYHQDSSPYRLTGFSASSNNASPVQYDSKGFMTSAVGRLYSWTSFGKPLRVTRGSAEVAFEYDANGSRAVKRDSQGTTYYVSPGYEKVLKNNGDTVHRYLIKNGYEVVSSIERIEYASELAEDEVDTRPQDKVAYYSRDIIGSGLVITGAKGQVVADRFYSPFGEELPLVAEAETQSMANNQTDSVTAYLIQEHQETVAQAEAELGVDEALLGRLLTVVDASSYLRGFTSHEQLDDVGLVHMNARLYDPQMARFVSPDSMIPDSYSPLAFNRYAYVSNNPALASDPTGHFAFLIGGTWALINTHSDNQTLIQLANIAVAVAVGVATGGSGYAPAQAALYAGGAALAQSAALSGRIGATELRTATFAAASAAAANQIGHGGPSTAAAPGGSAMFGEVWQVAAAHGASQGVLGMMQGKSFWNTFLAGSASHMAGHELGSRVDNPIEAALVATGVGALGASITGGDVVWAALTAATVHLYNEGASVAQEGASNNLAATSLDSGGDGQYMMCLASCVEENRFDLEATLGTLVGAAGGAPVPKTETELKRGGANNNPNISKDTTRLSRAGLEARAKHGKSAAGLSKGMRVTGRVLNTVAVPLLVFEGFYDWGTIGRCAVVCTGE